MPGRWIDRACPHGRRHSHASAFGKLDFALQFHVDAGESVPEPHEEAGNDGPSVVVEDGSNVVSVDFGRKK